MPNYLNPFSRVQTGLDWAERLQDFLDRFFAIICRNPFIEGQEIPGVILNAGSVTVIQHALGRTPRLWMLLDVWTNDLVSPPTEVERTDWDDKTITLHSGKAYKIRLWVV